MPSKEVQTRNHEGELMFHRTLSEAFEWAEIDDEVWKISFNFMGERIRLVRNGGAGWWHEPIELSDVTASVDSP